MDKPNTFCRVVICNSCYWAVLCNTFGVDGVGQKVFLSCDVFATKHAKIFSVGLVNRCPGAGLTCTEKGQRVYSFTISFKTAKQIPWFCKLSENTSQRTDLFVLFHSLPGSGHVCAFCSRAVSSKIKVILVPAEVVGGIERASSKVFCFIRIIIWPSVY